MVVLILLAGGLAMLIYNSQYADKLQYSLVVLVCVVVIPLYIGLFILIAYSGYILSRSV